MGRHIIRANGILPLEIGLQGAPSATWSCSSISHPLGFRFNMTHPACFISLRDQGHRNTLGDMSTVIRLGTGSQEPCCSHFFFFLTSQVLSFSLEIPPLPNSVKFTQIEMLGNWTVRWTPEWKLKICLQSVAVELEFLQPVIVIFISFTLSFTCPSSKDKLVWHPGKKEEFHNGYIHTKFVFDILLLNVYKQSTRKIYLDIKSRGIGQAFTHIVNKSDYNFLKSY